MTLRQKLSNSTALSVSDLDIRDLLQNAVNHARNPNPWDLGNSVLYRLCQENSLHNEDQAILAKIWLIGRSYAAAIERRRPGELEKEDNDDFYIKTVVPTIRKSHIDQWISELGKKYKKTTIESLNDILFVHAKVTNLFAEISGLQKRSLASKYLHFHLPELFFIYDQRADKRIKSLFSRLNFQKSIPTVEEHDHEYRKFFEKCLHLQSCIEKEFKTLLTPRELDNLLQLNIEWTI